MRFSIRACPRQSTFRSTRATWPRHIPWLRILRADSRTPGVGQIYIPQDMNYPAIRLNVDRVHAGELGLSQKDIVNNVITALNSNIMIAPNYWVDYKTGNDYFLTVQYAEHGQAAIHNLIDLTQIPLRAPNLKMPTTLDSVVKLENIESPTEIDHYQIQRVVDIYVTPSGEDLGRLTSAIHRTIADAKLPPNIRVSLRGMVEGHEPIFHQLCARFRHFVRAVVLDLVAQFRSFVDPFLIMLAIPMGFVGVLIILPLTHTTLNVMSLMGVLMLIGIADSNSILIVDFAHKLEEQGMSVLDACDSLPGAPAAYSDDFTGDHHWDDSHGDEAGRRRRAIHAHGPRDHRRTDFFGAADHLHRSSRLPFGVRQEAARADSATLTTVGGTRCDIFLSRSYSY
jgi:hypothetical protein